MRKVHQDNYFYSTDQNQTKYFPQSKQSDSQWQFQKVQSVYQVKKQHFHNLHQETQQIIPLRKYPLETYDLFKKNIERPKYQPNFVPSNIQTNNRSRPQYQESIFPRNSSSKTNSQTNIISQSQSLQYFSSQEPSFSNKGQFTVLQDFNFENFPSKDNKQTYQPMNRRNDWKIASFAPKFSKNLNLKEKCQKIFQFIQELKFMKEGFQSKLKQQKNYFTNQLQQLKKLLFKLNIKYEKQMLQFTKNNTQQSRLSSSRLSMQSDSKQNQLYELRLYCKRIEEEKQRSQQKFSSTLKKYQQQIEIISQELSRKINNENEKNLPSFQSLQINCQNCMRLQQIIQNYTTADQEVELWKNRSREQQERHIEEIKRMEEQIFKLQQKLSLMEKNKIQTQRKLKQKQRQIIYQQSEIQYRIKEIQKKQKDLLTAQIILKKQKDEIDAKKQKIADFQFKILRQQRKQKNEFKEKQLLSSEYFNSSNNDRRKIIPRTSNHYERSDSVSSKGSRIDINARLREIQMMKSKGQRNYDDSMNSRNSSKDSHYKEYTSSRVSNSTKNLKDYGINLTPSIHKEHKRESSQSIKLSQKLNRLTQTLQNQLRQMD